MIRGEEPSEQHKSIWKKYHGEEVEFEVFPPLKHDSLYFWLSVVCTRIHEIRLELGLPHNPRHGLHLTIGNLKN